MWIGGLRALQQALPASAHPVQPRSAVGRDRHGLHEPQPGGARRSRGRISSTRACGSTAKWWSATGRIRRCRSASAPGCGRRGRWHDWQGAKFARFGDNMRYVAVTEGDKVERARPASATRSMAMAWAIWLHMSMPVSDAEVTKLCAEYEERYLRGGAAAQGWRPARVAARRRPHRAGPARVS